MLKVYEKEAFPHQYEARLLPARTLTPVQWTGILQGTIRTIVHFEKVGLMARSVLEGFQAYLSRLEPSMAEVEKRKAHRRTIEQAMTAEFANFNELLTIGSHTRQSAIHLASDVDYFAKLGIGDVMYGNNRVASGTTLNRTKAALQYRFATTEVWIDGPAVVVGFGNGAGAVDVVPGIWVGTLQTSPRYPVFEIPDGFGGWQQTSPDRHTKYLRDEDDRSGYKLSKVVRLLKGWKYARTPKVPISGFHLELLLASSGTCVGAKAYQNCLLDAFRTLRDRKGSALTDPLGIAGWVHAAHTDNQRALLTAHAAYAAEKATAAIQAEIAGRPDHAFAYWQLVFNGQFPSR